MITVDNYSKSYGDTIAVNGLSFTVPPGAILGMVGPNGAGKTTTLRAIAGIIQPTAGRMLIGNHDINVDSIKAKQQLAYIPDEPRLFEPLTVWEHLMFSAAAYKVKQFEPIAEQLLQQFELTEKRDVIVQELSRGMRQKVAICAAYLHQPKAILFDEPHTGLDPHAIRTMKETVLQRAQAGAAVIVSSHLLSMIEDTCTHLLILIKGQAVFHGTLQEVREKYPDLDDGSSLEKIFFRATLGETDQPNGTSTDSQPAQTSDQSAAVSDSNQ